MFASKDLFFTNKSGGYQISRSVRLRSSASAYFNRTPASASNRTTWTWSGWVKRGALGSVQSIFTGYANPSAFSIRFLANDTVEVFEYNAGFSLDLITTQVFRDPSAWYHVTVAMDTTQATASNRTKLYINGQQVTAFSTATYPTQNFATGVDSAGVHYIGQYVGSSYFDGYLTEINFIDGQALTPSSFGQTNSVTGVWQPIKYTGTYGTNGFYLNFSDNSAATAAAIGKDYSGNGNNWTPNNISVTAGVTYDSMLDVPTMWADGGNGRGNYPVISPLVTSSAGTISAGNLNISGTSTSGQCQGTMGASSGKWYWEVTTNWDTGQASFSAGVSKDTVLPSTYAGQSADSYVVGVGGQSTIFTYNNATQTSYTATPATPVVLQIALDLDNNKVWFGVNNTWVTGNPSAGTGQTYTIANAGTYLPAFRASGGTTSTTGSFNAGQRPFSYTPPTGFVALNTQNLPTPTISNGAAYMAATTYTGTGASLTIANTVGSTSFQPDFVWVKGRSGATDHALYDSVRGATKDLVSNSTAAETTQATGLTAFGSTGFTVGALAKMNTNAATYVGWQWQAGGTAVSNTAGTITSSVSANPTAGFSVVTFTSDGTTAGGTVGHGLGVAPSMVIYKGRNTVDNWFTYHVTLGGSNAVFLNLTNASTATSLFNATTPTSSVIQFKQSNWGAGTVVAYCFAAVAGYSKFGSYTGNGSTDGPFVFTNFQPRWVMVKRTDSTSDWYIWDTSRDTYNVEAATLLADTSGAETSATSIDGLSNGFKCRSATVVNASGGTYIYAAFASSPFRNSLAR